jgi:hypothetical protein
VSDYLRSDAPVVGAERITVTISTHDAGQPLSPPAPVPPSGTGASANEIIAGESVPSPSQAPEPQATRLECPNDATLLVWDDNGSYCVVCGYPRSEKKPTRPPELDDYLGRLRRGEDGADAKGLAEFARKLGLRWGRPELTPDRSLKFSNLGSATLAVQEATGSDKYLVVLCGEVNWSTGLLQFFKVEGGIEPPPERVRLSREAVAQLIDGKSLLCPDPGELKVVARKPKPEPRAAPSPPTPTIAPMVLPSPQPAAGIWLSPQAKTLALAAFGLAIVLVVWLVNKSHVPKSGAPPTAEYPAPPVPPLPIKLGTGSLEVSVNCAATGNLDGWFLSETGKRPSQMLIWQNQPARAHRLKIICQGYEDYTQQISIPEGERMVLPVTLHRR